MTDSFSIVKETLFQWKNVDLVIVNSRTILYRTERSYPFWIETKGYAYSLTEDNTLIGSWIWNRPFRTTPTAAEEFMNKVDTRILPKQQINIDSLNKLFHPNSLSLHRSNRWLLYKEVLETPSEKEVIDKLYYEKHFSEQTIRPPNTRRRFRTKSSTTKRDLKKTKAT